MEDVWVWLLNVTAHDVPDGNPLSVNVIEYWFVGGGGGVGGGDGGGDGDDIGGVGVIGIHCDSGI